MRLCRARSVDFSVCLLVWSLHGTVLQRALCEYSALTVSSNRLLRAQTGEQSCACPMKCSARMMDSECRKTFTPGAAFPPPPACLSAGLLLLPCCHSYVAAAAAFAGTKPCCLPAGSSKAMEQSLCLPCIWCYSWADMG